MAELRRDRLGDDEIELLAGAVSTWASVHPSPSEPVLALGRQQWSPDTLAGALRERDPGAEPFLRMILVAVDDFAQRGAERPFESVLEMFQQPRVDGPRLLQ